MLDFQAFADVVENSNEEVHAGRTHFYVYQRQEVRNDFIDIQSTPIDWLLQLVLPVMHQRYYILADVLGQPFAQQPHT